LAAELGEGSRDDGILAAAIDCCMASSFSLSIAICSDSLFVSALWAMELILHDVSGAGDGRHDGCSRAAEPSLQQHAAQPNQCEPQSNNKYPAVTKSTREIQTARQVARDYLKRYPKDRYDTVVESWADIQCYNIQFVMSRLREPKEPKNEGLSDQPGTSSQRGR
jgi:hypothetical protein